MVLTRLGQPYYVLPVLTEDDVQQGEDEGEEGEGREGIVAAAATQESGPENVENKHWRSSDTFQFKSILPIYHAIYQKNLIRLLTLLPNLPVHLDHQHPGWLQGSSGHTQMASNP